MKTRLALLLVGLLAPLCVHAFDPAGHGAGPVLIDPAAQTQAGTRELPLRYKAPAGADAKARLAYWSEAGLRAIAYDHTPEYPGKSPVLFEQYGPPRSSRALAILHIAVYDGLNAIYRRYPGYSTGLTAYADSSPDAAIAQSAHDVLVALYPRQTARFDRVLSDDLARLPATRQTRNGIDIGRRAAAAILALRAYDGSRYAEALVGQTYFPVTAPGVWQPDPVSQSALALGAYWSRQTPFVASSAAAFDPGPPPALTSDAYTAAFNEVKRLGGDGINTPTERTLDQTAAGIYWAYDGAAWVGATPRQYAQIAMQLAKPRAADALELARAMALVSVAVADATMAVWHTKYAYDFWRPVHGIRAASPGGPYGTGDGNPATQAAFTWTPLGSPASNLAAPNFTPPFPAYTSGHAGLGSAMFQVLRRLYGDNIAFTFVSDELNGITRDNKGLVRPRLPRSFRTLSQAEEENGQSRIYLGVHWAFDKTRGIETGRRVADEVIRRGLVPPSQ